MRIIAMSLLALTTLSGCLALHADLPAEAVLRHMAREDGVEMGAICSQEGQSFSEGAIVCMAKRRMTCDPTARWVEDGAC